MAGVLQSTIVVLFPGKRYIYDPVGMGKLKAMLFLIWLKMQGLQNLWFTMSCSEKANHYKYPFWNLIVHW